MKLGAGPILAERDFTEITLFIIQIHSFILVYEVELSHLHIHITLATQRNCITE